MGSQCDLRVSCGKSEEVVVCRREESIGGHPWYPFDGGLAVAGECEGRLERLVTGGGCGGGRREENSTGGGARGRRGGGVGGGGRLREE